MWTYIQESGKILNATGKVIAVGYSGLGVAKNDPSAQHVPNMGPIPVGKYTIMPPINSPKHGPYAMHLEPFADDEMFNRSQFMLHGDSKEHPGAASEGCIILGRGARETIWQSGDHQLEVIAQLIEVGDEDVASD